MLELADGVNHKIKLNAKLFFDTLTCTPHLMSDSSSVPGSHGG